jgi:hypothetical protein
MPFPVALIEAVSPATPLSLIWLSRSPTVVVLLLTVTVAVAPAAVVMVNVPSPMPAPPFRLASVVSSSNHCLFRSDPASVPVVDVPANPSAVAEVPAATDRLPVPPLASVSWMPLPLVFSDAVTSPPVAVLMSSSTSCTSVAPDRFTE